MVYADADYYKNIYKGNFGLGEGLDDLLYLASIKIDTISNYKIVDFGFDNYPERTKSKIKKACCIIADFYSNQDVNSLGNNDGDFLLSSFSNLETRASIDTTTYMPWVKLGIPQSAYMYLVTSGLLQRGVG